MKIYPEITKAQQDALNEDAATNPQVGDYWQEMMAWHMFVVYVDEHYVVTACTPGPGHPSQKNVSWNNQEPYQFPRDAEFQARTREEFKRWLQYGNIPGYWTWLTKRGCNVEGWLEGRVSFKPVVLPIAATTEEVAAT